MGLGGVNHAARGGDGRAKRLREALAKTLTSSQRAQAQKLSVAFHPENPQNSPCPAPARNVR